MNIKNAIVSLIFSASLVGCSNNIRTLNTNSPSSNKESVEFDLSQYFYHENLKEVGGRISYKYRHYDRPTGRGLMYLPEAWYVRTTEGIEFLRANGGAFSRDTIKESTIDKIGVSYESSRVYDRYVRIGEVFTQGERQPNSLRETCTLKNHFDTFDVGAATAYLRISKDVYSDVIQVFCESTFDTSDGGTRPNYSWDQYYARGIGLVYMQGSWPNFQIGGDSFDDIFAIPEY